MKVKYNQTKGTKKQPPWWDNECEMAKSNKYILLRKFRRTNTGVDLHSYKAAKARFKNIFRINECQSKSSGILEIYKKKKKNAVKVQT